MLALLEMALKDCHLNPKGSFNELTFQEGPYNTHGTLLTESCIEKNLCTVLGILIKEYDVNVTKGHLTL